MSTYVNWLRPHFLSIYSEGSEFPDIVVDAKGFVELRQGGDQGTDDHSIFSEMYRAENRAAENLKRSETI